jgi:hypothetical protein
VRETPPAYEAVATPASGENAPVIDLKKLGDDDTKVLMKLRSSVRIPAAKPVALPDEDDVEELDIDIELDGDVAARKGRPSDVPRPSFPSGSDDTLYGMNMTGTMIPETPRVPRLEADDERTQVMEPKPRPPVDPDATVRIQRKR